MSERVKQVRKSIEQRKKNQRTLSTKGLEHKKISPVFPQEEEKHGYYPTLPDGLGSSHKANRGKWVSGMMLKGILAVILFFGTALIYQTDSEAFQKPVKWTTTALTKEFPFAKANQWYQETFGEPLALAPEDKTSENHSEAVEALALPVNGTVEESFQVNGSGIMIAPKDSAEVAVLREGVVVFAGNDRKTDKTVIVQHTDGSTSTYGYLDSIDVHLYQHVTDHQTLGEFEPDETNKTVFFAIEKDNQYMDPVQVIKVNDTP
ncbi:M23 family metallopeptidase [Lentibacillus sp. N15]|uniref:M23 family metallopeptidase n=1 Tax=Lentibacillus songyuanensis TaxID=3136161 RepID=UPI0031BA0231